jgi:hypothetical protein
MAVTWGFRLWLALLLLCMGLFLIVDAPIETTGGGSLVLILSGGVAAALIVRALRGPSVEPGLLDATGALPDRSLDYLVWWTLGIVVLGLVVGVAGLLLRSP